MEILNVGIPEFLLITLLMLILLGPDGMVKTARSMAKWVRTLVRSPMWSDMMKTRQELQEIPTRLVREAGIDELNKEVRQINQEVRDTARQAAIPLTTEEVSILPPPVKAPPTQPEQPAPQQPEEPPATPENDPQP